MSLKDTIVLKNYSASPQSGEPEWIGSALTDPAASSRLRNLALQARSYLDGDKRRFIHLVDGGVSDNLGLRGSTDSAVVYAGGSDRKSTRLNSSHLGISYAVFCLKKKKKNWLMYHARTRRTE